MAMVETAKITSKGQVTIPSRIRKVMNAAQGDTLLWEVLDDGRVIVSRVDPLDLEYHKSVAKTLGEWQTREDEEAYGDL